MRERIYQLELELADREQRIGELMDALQGQPQNNDAQNELEKELERQRRESDARLRARDTQLKRVTSELEKVRKSNAALEFENSEAKAQIEVN